MQQKRGPGSDVSVLVSDQSADPELHPGSNGSHCASGCSFVLGAGFFSLTPEDKKKKIQRPNEQK